MASNQPSPRALRALHSSRKRARPTPQASSASTPQRGGSTADDGAASSRNRDEYKLLVGCGDGSGDGVRSGGDSHRIDANGHSGGSGDGTAMASNVVGATSTYDPTFVPRWVYFFAFDDDRPLLVDTKLLCVFSCRSSKLIQYQAPDIIHKGRPAWFMSTSRAILVAFIKALVHHEIIISRDVDYHDLVQYLEYENVVCPATEAVSANATDVSPPPPCIGARRSMMSGNDASFKLANVIASAILEWRRLYYGMTTAANGNDPGYAVSASRVWIKLAHRADTRMAHFSSTTDAIHTLVTIQQPHWLKKTLHALGMVHYTLVRSEMDKDALVFTECASDLSLRSNLRSATCSGPRCSEGALAPFIVAKSDVHRYVAAVKRLRMDYAAELRPIKNDPDGCCVLTTRKLGAETTTSSSNGECCLLDEEPRVLLGGRYSATSAAFCTLAEKVSDDHLGHYFTVRYDIPRSERDSDVAQQKAMIKHATKFSKMILHTVSEADKWPQHPAEDVTYARACVALAERLVREMPNCGRIYGDACVATHSLDNGAATAARPTKEVKDMTPERRALSKAFAQHRIRVIEWKTDDNDSSFAPPPLVFPPNLFTRTTRDRDPSGPCVLVEIDTA